MNIYLDELSKAFTDSNIKLIMDVGEGITIAFDSGLLFDVDKSDLRPQAKTNLESLAKILNK